MEMDFNISEQALENIFDLIDKLDSSSVGELELEMTTEAGRQARITLRKPAPQQASGPVAAPTAQSVAVVQTEAVPQAKAPEDGGMQVRSQLVGVFYVSSSPDTPPLITVGQKVKKGDVLCIIEAMKVMNEIESDFDGTIEQICVKNGEMVEFGQVLFVIK